VVLDKLNLPQLKPNYENDKVEAVIQLSYHQESAEKWLKTTSDCLNIYFILKTVTILNYRTFYLD